MAITARRINSQISISGSSQSATPGDVLGRIDQIILESSTSGQTVDLIIENDQSQEIYRNEAVFVDTTTPDIRPNLLPMGPITIKLENPTNESGTITVTLIEKERG